VLVIATWFQKNLELDQLANKQLNTLTTHCKKMESEGIAE